MNYPDLDICYQPFQEGSLPCCLIKPIKVPLDFRSDWNFSLLTFKPGVWTLACCWTYWYSLFEATIFCWMARSDTVIIPALRKGSVALIRRQGFSSPQPPDSKHFDTYSLFREHQKSWGPFFWQPGCSLALLRTQRTSSGVGKRCGGTSGRLWPMRGVVAADLVELVGPGLLASILWKIWCALKSWYLTETDVCYPAKSWCSLKSWLWTKTAVCKPAKIWCNQKL